MKKIRTFISIDIPKNIQKDILKIQKSLKGFKGKFTEPENLHLTLKFLGEVSEEKIELVKKKLREIKFNSFETEIIHAGIFDNRKSKIYPRKLIVWLHLTNCEKLQKTIDNALKDLFKSERRFMSHLTIARVKNIKDKEQFLESLKAAKIPKMKFTVKEFKLKKSTLTEKGSVYEDIAAYKLL